MLNGEKITLRPIEPNDAESLNILRQDFDATKAFVGSPFPGNISSQKEWINSMYPGGMLKNIYFAIEENATKKFIGYVAARNINYIHSNAEIGEILIKESRGKGYFKEILLLFTDYLFNQLNLKKLFTTILIDNQVSIHSHKKFGFIEEGLMKEHVYQDNTFKDVVILSLFKYNYNKNN